MSSRSSEHFKSSSSSVCKGFLWLITISTRHSTIQETRETDSLSKKGEVVLLHSDKLVNFHAEFG